MDHVGDIFWFQSPHCPPGTSAQRIGVVYRVKRNKPGDSPEMGMEKVKWVVRAPKWKMGSVNERSKVKEGVRRRRGMIVA